MAGLLTSPSACAFSKERVLQWLKIAALIRMTQLRAQSRNHTGFPFEHVGVIPNEAPLSATNLVKIDILTKDGVEKRQNVAKLAILF